MTTDAAISPLDLKQSPRGLSAAGGARRPAAPAFDADPQTIPGAIRCAPDGRRGHRGGALEPWRPVIVYCVHGHEVGRDAAAALRAQGLDARHLEGGLEAWRAAGFATRAWRAPTRWVTRARPKIDRIACPWLIRRFVDPAAEIFYVPSAEVRAFAAEHGATPYDMPDVKYRHVGAECSFDAFIRLHALDDPALAQLATIVRGADTSALAARAGGAGLLAVSRGLSALFTDDHAMLKWGMLVYDALYVLRVATRTPAHRGARRLTRQSHRRGKRRRGPRAAAPARKRSATGSGSASSPSAGRRARSRSCITISWTAEALDLRAALPARAQLLHGAARARRRSSSPPTSAGSCTGRGAASWPARCSCCPRSSS